MGAYLPYLWLFFLFLNIAEFRSIELAVWVLAAICFVGLKEYFSLVDLRVQDRFSMWGAYLSIPFMIYLIQVDWYGLFIISIPVYAFLVTSFLITVGGWERTGTVFSIGVINIGLFLFVYCIGHLGYLARVSIPIAATLVLGVVVCDAITHLFGRRGTFTWNKLFAAAPFTVLFVLACSQWTTLSWQQSVFIGVLIPVLVGMSRRTLAAIEVDLKIDPEHLQPGTGQIIDSVKSFLFAAPIIFHYVWYSQS